MRKSFFYSAIALLVPVFFIFSAFTNSPKPNEGINWVSIEEAEALAAKDGKNILVDVYTDWCGWCKRMDKSTYENQKVINYINENFHAVKFDAEQKGDVTLKGRTFKFVAQGRRGYHELAAGILQGKMSYPSTVFLNSQFEILTDIKGFRGPDEMMGFLTYFKDELYKEEISLQKYLDDYKSSN